MSNHLESIIRPVLAALAAAICAIGLLAGCLSDVGRHQADFLVFGTQATVTVRDVDSRRAEQAFARVGRDLQRMHREWHPWRSGALSDLNRALPDGGWVRTTPDLVRLTVASREFEAASGGLFNPAIGGLVRMWGFHTSDYPITEPPPAAEAIESLLAYRPSMSDIEVDRLRLRSNNRAVRLDFSGLAKGLAAERVCERLAEFDIVNALIDLGGDVMVCGASDPAWRVAIPDRDQDVLTTVELTESMAIFTSGNYHRYGEWDGERYAHILDPGTGYPVEGIMQATVIDPDPMRADAAATALVVAGPVMWRSVADSMGIERAIVIDTEGRVELTEALEDELL